MEKRRVYRCEGMLANSRCSAFSHRQVHKIVKIFCLVFSSLCNTLQDLVHITEKYFVIYWQCSFHITRCRVSLQLEIYRNTHPVFT